MPSIPYTLDTPVSTNTPSQDVANLTQNTNSVSAFNDVDHKTFSNTLAGRHRQISMTNQSSPGLNSNDGVLYANAVNGGSWPHWLNSTDDFPIFSVSPVFPATLVPGLGVIPLAANMIMQFGIFTTTSNGSVTPNQVTLAFAFPQSKIFSIQVTSQVTSNGVTTDQSIQSIGVDNQHINIYVGTGIPIGTLLWWQVIGA